MIIRNFLISTCQTGSTLFTHAALPLGMNWYILEPVFSRKIFKQ